MVSTVSATDCRAYRFRLMLYAFLFQLLVTPMASQTLYPDFKHKTLDDVRHEKGWYIIAEARGNLNRDINEDGAMVLESKDILTETRCDGCDEQRSKGRIVIVFSAGKVIAQNNMFIARAEEGGITGDIKPSLAIANRQLDIFYMLARGEDHYFFELKGNDVVLVKASKLRASHYLFRSDIVDFKKRKLITERKLAADQPAERTATTLKLQKRLVKLSELKMIGTWDVGGVFL